MAGTLGGKKSGPPGILHADVRLPRTLPTGRYAAARRVSLLFYGFHLFFDFRFFDIFFFFLVVALGRGVYGCL